jgi:hypothetical protein
MRGSVVSRAEGQGAAMSARLRSNGRIGSMGMLELPARREVRSSAQRGRPFSRSWTAFRTSVDGVSG